MSFPPSPNELLEAFQEMEDWEERYEYLLELGRELPSLPDQYRTEENKVHGCMSTVWMRIEPEPFEGDSGQQPIRIQADSDSLIVKGLIVILLSLYQGRTAEEAVSADPAAFFSTLGLNQHLSPNRRNGLYAMVGRIRELSLQRAAGVR